MNGIINSLGRFVDTESLKKIFTLLDPNSGIVIEKTSLIIDTVDINTIIQEITTLINSRDRKRILREKYGVKLTFENDLEYTVMKIKSVNEANYNSIQQIALLIILLVFSKDSPGINFNFQKPVLGNPIYTINITNRSVNIELLSEIERNLYND